MCSDSMETRQAPPAVRAIIHVSLPMAVFDVL